MGRYKTQILILIGIAILFCAVIIGFNIFFVKEPSQVVFVEKETTAETTDTVESAVVSEDNTVVNINTATADELKKLDKIGDALAERIIEYRNTYGGFKTIEEIKNVNGIGDAIFESNKDRMEVK